MRTFALLVATLALPLLVGGCYAAAVGVALGIASLASDRGARNTSAPAHVEQLSVTTPESPDRVGTPSSHRSLKKS